MYEVFLTAHVEDSDFGAACAILSGLSGMSPWESVHRNLLFQGPPKPAGISNQSSIDKPIRKEVGLLWKDLHQNLIRQSFILQARYEVLKDRYLDQTAPPMDFDATPGILRWTDFPDPPKGRPVLIQRKKVELWEQKKLPSVMRDNLFQCASPKSIHIYLGY
jgi:mediator of RNA polymerase II transcription subunit 18